MATPTLFHRITIIGLGLIGSSLARACRQHQLAGMIVGCDSNDIALAYGRKHGFIDSGDNNAALAVKGSQLVILATPPASFAAIAQAIAPYLEQGALVMDTGSVKQTAMADIAPHLPGYVSFIPAHPVAGSEQSGVSAGRADLFMRKRVIITPEEPLHGHTLHSVMAFWQAMGAQVEGMPAAIHDMIYAYVSHLPQLLAYAGAPLVDAPDYPETTRAFLRLSRSSPALWADIFNQNKENLLSALDRYLDVVLHIKHELEQAPVAADEENEPNPLLVQGVLFPRLAASCLITTIMEAEKNAGFPFARYAGSGFADFTAPACLPPEADIEQISGQYKEMASITGAYIERLKQFRYALSETQFKIIDK